MNKKLTLFLFIIISFSKLYSQNLDSVIKIVFTEKTTNRVDSASLKLKYTKYKRFFEKTATLYINKESSYYTSNEYNNYRELYSNVLNNNSLDPEANQSKIVVESALGAMIVIKDFNRIYERKIGSNTFQVNDFLETNGIYKKFYFKDSIEKVNWKLDDETKVVANFLCQKATGVFRGRRWEVWFTNKLPISAGPWKLYGLPGLILEARDSASLYSFEAEIVVSPIAKPSDNSITINNKVVMTNLKEWLQLSQKNFNDKQEKFKKFFELIGNEMDNNIVGEDSPRARNDENIRKLKMDIKLTYEPLELAKW